MGPRGAQREQKTDASFPFQTPPKPARRSHHVNTGINNSGPLTGADLIL